MEERKQVTNVALPLFVEEAKSSLDSIESDLLLLATVATHYVAVRKFVKLDGFVYTWPEIARLAMRNYSSLGYVEDCLISRKPRPSDADLDAREARELFDLCANDAALIRFLRLRPYFGEISQNDLRRYRPLAPAVVPDLAQSVPLSSAAPDVAAAQQSAPIVTSQIDRVYEMTVRKLSSELITDGRAELRYEVTLSLPDEKPMKSEISFSIKKCLTSILEAIGVSSEDSLQPFLKELFAQSSSASEALLVRAGMQLQNTILNDSQMQKRFVELLNGEQSVRIVTGLSDPQLHSLPWEWLPRPGHPELLLSNPRFSIVRSLTDQVEVSHAPLTSPLQLMSVMPSPPKGVRISFESSAKALKALASVEKVRYHPLLRQQATFENVGASLESFRPQILHFEGHVTFSPDAIPFEKTIRLFFTSTKSEDEVIEIGQFAHILKTTGVQLVVIGRNQVSPVYKNPGPAIAMALLQLGLPAVLMPVRAIDDGSATAFTMDFYRAFLQGNRLEEAIHQARRKLSSIGGDWSAW